MYNKWKEWAYNNGVQYFGIKSYNSWQFVLHGLYPIGNIRYYFIVTYKRVTFYPYDTEEKNTITSEEMMYLTSDEELLLQVKELIREKMTRNEK